MNEDLSLALFHVLLCYHGRLPNREIDNESVKLVLGDALDDKSTIRPRRAGLPPQSFRGAPKGASYAPQSAVADWGTIKCHSRVNPRLVAPE